MMTPLSESALRLERLYSAVPDRVWEAWTNPEYARQWLAPGAYTIPEIVMDVRVGGQYRVVMENPETRERLHLIGEYREVSRAKRLVYSWVWKTDADVSPETVVTVTFREQNGSTQVTVDHELFPDAPTRDRHIGGWSACLEKLTAVVS